MEERYITTDGHSFAYEEVAKEHQHYIDRINYVDSMIDKHKDT